MEPGPSWEGSSWVLRERESQLVFSLGIIARQASVSTKPQHRPLVRNVPITPREDQGGPAGDQLLNLQFRIFLLLKTCRRDEVGTGLFVFLFLTWRQGL